MPANYRKSRRRRGLEAPPRRVTLSMDDALVDRVDRAAAKYGVSRSALIEKAVEFGLKSATDTARKLASKRASK